MFIIKLLFLSPSTISYSSVMMLISPLEKNKSSDSIFMNSKSRRECLMTSLLTNKIGQCS